MAAPDQAIVTGRFLRFALRCDAGPFVARPCLVDVSRCDSRQIARLERRRTHAENNAGEIVERPGRSGTPCLTVVLDNVYLAQRILDKLEAASGVAIDDVPSEPAPGQGPQPDRLASEGDGRSGFGRGSLRPPGSDRDRWDRA